MYGLPQSKPLTLTTVKKGGGKEANTKIQRFKHSIMMK